MRWCGWVVGADPPPALPRLRLVLPVGRLNTFVTQARKTIGRCDAGRIDDMTRDDTNGTVLRSTVFGVDNQRPP